MDLEAALALLAKLEGSEEPLRVIRGEIKARKDKEYELIAENRKLTSRARLLEQSLDDIVGSTGVSGEGEERYAAAQEKVKELTTKLTELEQTKTRLAGLERSVKISEVATTLKAQPKVLEIILGNTPLERVKIEGEDVRIQPEENGKFVPLKEYAESKYSYLLPSLFVEQKPATKLPAGPKKPTTSDLPNGGSKGAPEEKPTLDPVKRVLRRPKWVDKQV